MNKIVHVKDTLEMKEKKFNYLMVCVKWVEIWNFFKRKFRFLISLTETNKKCKNKQTNKKIKNDSFFILDPKTTCM